MRLRSIIPLTLVSLISCTKYPENRNLSILADAMGYTIYGDTGEETSYTQLGAVNNPAWLEDLSGEIKIQISLSGDGGEQKIIYDDFFLDEKGVRRAPSLPKVLDAAHLIGADCGFHHPDSLEPCYAGVKGTEPVTILYSISTFPGEKKTYDNSAKVTLTVNDLQANANALSSVWNLEAEKEKGDAQKEGVGIK